MRRSLCTLLGSNARSAIKRRAPYSVEKRRPLPAGEPPTALDRQKPGEPHSSYSEISSRMLTRLRNSAAGRDSAPADPAEDSAGKVVKEISMLLGTHEAGSLHLTESKDELLLQNILDVPWFSNVSNSSATQLKKEVSRERKQKHVYKNTKSRRFSKLMRMCENKLGAESTLEIFGKLGRETGIKEYNALIDICIQKAKGYSNEDSLFQMQRVYQLLLSMKERGFLIEEDTFGPVLMHMVDMQMIHEFESFSKLIRDNNPSSCSRIGYYEILLWIRVEDENKIRDLCNDIEPGNPGDCFMLYESYLLALCESDRKELLQFLEVLDITRISSLDYVAVIFKSLGRLKLEHFTNKFILALKTTDIGGEAISSFLYDYASSIPKFKAEELVQKFASLHEQLELEVSITAGCKLITFFCDSSQVQAALDVSDYMFRSGLDVPIETFHLILQACELCCEQHLVRSIYSMIRNYNVKPKVQTFKCMIDLYVKIKDFEGAYNLLSDMEEQNEMPSTSIFNSILVGYLRDKNTSKALMVLKQMETVNIKPDSDTFRHLISYCECVEDIVKYREELHRLGVPITKYIFMSLINAYANLGRFDLAKQVILDKDVPVKYLNELKNVLVSALSNNKQVQDALVVHDEIKQAGESLEPKAIVNLIESIQYEGEFDRLHQLLEDLKGSKNWFDGCSRVILYCVRYKLSKHAIKLLNQLKSKNGSSACMVINQVFCQIWESGPASLELGIEIYRAIQEELGLRPSRICLDFLLSACVKAKNLQYAQMVWLEYDKAGLPYNVLSYLRMYQALLASGQHEAASKIILQVPKNDLHVRFLVKSCKSACGVKGLSAREGGL